MLTRRTTICCVALCICLRATLSFAQAAPTPEASTDHRILALDPRWTVSLTSPPAAPPGFDQQMAYVPLKDGQILGIDLNEGRVLWSVAAASEFAPASGDGLVFVADATTLIALDQSGGRTLWRSAMPAPLAAPLVWDGGWVFASLTNGELIAFAGADGQVLWRNPLESPLAVPPSFSQDTLYVALRANRLAALDLKTGSTTWTLPLEQSATGVLALEDQLLVGTRANLLHSVSLTRPRIRWSQKAGADVIGAPAADDSTIYFVAFDNVLRALDRGNGNLRWRRNLPSRPSGGALRIDDVVLVPFATNDIGAFLASTGAPSFTIQAAGELGAAPFLRDGVRRTAPRLIAISREGALQGFAPRFEPAPVPLSELPGARVGS